MAQTRVASLVLRWYRRHARDLPWRRRRSPYRTWVSEVMLQQTRVETVIPYFHRWMQRFPSLRSLAGAREQSVLALWEGLGYYSRARNLHRAARLVVTNHRGRIPSDPAVLRLLPGVGDYIASAVASIAFGRDIVALDANVMRVLARLTCLRHPLATAEGRRRLRIAAAMHLPPGRAGDFNQALMDLGALVCLPRQPRCERCPLSQVCQAHARGLQDRVPVRRKPRPRPHYHARAAVVVTGNKVLLRRRDDDGLLGGLWEFPKSADSPSPPSHADLAQQLRAGVLQIEALRTASRRSLAVVDHTYSHFSVTVRAFLCTASDAAVARGAAWVVISRLPKYPMGKIDRTIALHLGRTVSAGER